MALQITVVAGPKPGTRFPLRKDLVRIGSASACEICLPGGEVPAHAASLEITGDTCRVHNRCGQPLLCAGRTLPPQQAATWGLGTDLELVPGVVLRLEALSAAPQGTPRPAWEEETGAEQVEGTAAGPATVAAQAAKAANPQQTMQLGVTLACVALSGLLLWNKLAGSPEDKGAAAVVKISLNDVLDQLDSAPATAAWDEVRHAIQAGYRLERSGDQEGARRRYQRIIQIVLGQRAAVDFPVAEEVTEKQRRQLAGVAAELPEGPERSVFLYAFGRL